MYVVVKEIEEMDVFFNEFSFAWIVNILNA